jgi:DNA replication protein DnaC
MIELKIPAPTQPDDAGDARELQYSFSEALRRAEIELAKRVPPRFAEASIDHPAVGSWAQDLVNHAVRATPYSRPLITCGPSLLILGPTGVGKSHQTYGAINQLSRTGLLGSWAFTTAPDLYGSLRPRHGVDTERLFQELLGARLLVVDDLGAAKSSEWVEEINYRLVNTRYEQQRPTIYTSNLTGAQLREVVGDRVASRLSDCRHVALTGPDRRRRAA